MKKLLTLILTCVLLAACAEAQPLTVSTQVPPPAPYGITLEQAQEVFGLWWGQWGHEIRYTGEVTIDRYREPRRSITDSDYPDIFTDLPEPVTLYVFETGDLRSGVSKECGTVYFHGGFADCGEWEKDGGVAERDESKELPELFIVDISLTGLSYTFVNQTDKEFIYGECYSLYIRRGSSWRLLNRDMAFASIGYNIMPLSQTREREICWEWLLGELSAGEYKIEKSISFGRGQEREEYVLEQRFTISR